MILKEITYENSMGKMFKTWTMELKVTKATEEQLTNLIGGRFNAQRAILKYVSADYLD